MHANLFEHDPIQNRNGLNKIWDAVPANLSIREMEREFIRRAVAAGHDAEEAEGFLLGDPSC